MAESRSLTLLSPAGAQAEEFSWISPKKGEFGDESSEIVDIIYFVHQDVKELRENRELCEAIKNTDKGSYSAVSTLCDLYNTAVVKLLEQWSKSNVKPSFLGKRACKAHVQFILLQCYNRAVAEPDKLNQYPPFSPQVYGETSFELISQMIDTVKISSDESFIDLGSGMDIKIAHLALGVGQVVLQVAACSDAKFCYGIEKAEYPALCASNLDAEFRRWMAFYGKSYRPYLLERGDFLSPECHDRIATAGVLFANNFAFGPEVDHQLKQRFANLKEGARIISSKAFCPLNFRITDRNLSDIGSIMHVSCLNPIQDAVSWTDKPFSYYVHTIDRSLLERYFSRLKNPNLRDEAEVIRRDRKGRIISEQALKDGYHINGSNGAEKLSKEATSGPHAVRHRRSQSLGLPRPGGQIRRCSTIGSDSKRHLSAGHRSCSSHSRVHLKRDVHSTGTGQRRRRRQTRDEPEPSYALHIKLSGSTTLTKKSKLAKSKRLHRTIVDNRLASLNLNSDSNLLLSSASESNIDSCLAESSGHTTPSGSTSLSSVGCAHDDVHSGGSETEKHRKFTRYSPVENDQAHLSSSDRNGPIAWHPGSSSSSSSSSFVSSSLPASLPRSPTVVVDDGISSKKTTTLSSLSNSELLVPNFTQRKVASNIDVTKSSEQPPIRITLSLSRKKAMEMDPVQADPEGDKTLTAEPDSKSETQDTSVARRRAIRKCRQLPQTAHPLAPSVKYRGRGKPGVLCNSRQRLTKGRSFVHSTCRPLSGRGRIASLRNVEMLHAETVAQIRATRAAPNQPYGLNDPAMSSFTCHYQPVELGSLKSARLHALHTATDANLGHSEEAVPFALTQYLELTKRVFMDHFTALRSPAYLDMVRQQLAFEQTRQAELLARTRTLEDNIKRLHADGCDLLRSFTKRLGILISTPSAFFAQARKLIKHHHTLEDKIAEFRNEISQLSNANQDLVKRHQIEAARLLSTALHTAQPVATHVHEKRGYKVSGGERSPSSNTIVTTARAPPSSDPPSLTHMLSNDSSQTHLGKSHSGNRIRRPLPRLSPQRITPLSSNKGTSHSNPPNQAPILFRSPEEPLRPNNSQTTIPPPPPLLPMHNSRPIIYTQNNQPAPSSSMSPSNCSGSHPDIKVLNSSPLHDRPKSMHASLQDLIVDEFSRPKSDYTSPNLKNTFHESNVTSKAAASSSTHLHSLPPRKRAWSVTDTDHSSTKYSRLQSVNGSTTRALPSSPPALSPVSTVSPHEIDVTGTESRPAIRANGISLDKIPPSGVLLSSQSSRGVPPPLLCATDYPSNLSSSRASITLPLPMVATSALRP